jgi:hypothetical protein
MTTKYSAGYLQRKKMFSSKKETIDQLNIKNNQTIGTEKPKTHYKGVEGQKDRSSKSKKLND